MIRGGLRAAAGRTRAEHNGDGERETVVVTEFMTQPTSPLSTACVLETRRNRPRTTGAWKLLQWKLADQSASEVSAAVSAIRWR